MKPLRSIYGACSHAALERANNARAAGSLNVFKPISNLVELTAAHVYARPIATRIEGNRTYFPAEAINRIS